MTFCPLCSSFHFAWNAGMIFPYTSRGVLYAANVITGVEACLHVPVPEFVLPLLAAEHAAPARAATTARASAALRVVGPIIQASLVRGRLFINPMELTMSVQIV